MGHDDVRVGKQGEIMIIVGLYEEVWAGYELGLDWGRGWLWAGFKLEAELGWSRSGLRLGTAVGGRDRVRGQERARPEGEAGNGHGDRELTPPLESSGCQGQTVVEFLTQVKRLQRDRQTIVQSCR